jgi:NADH-quinone oxidoreductase subunit H
MMEYIQILGSEVYKILFLLVPILVSVAMIVWLDRRVWGLVQKRKRTKCCWSIWFTPNIS